MLPSASPRAVCISSSVQCARKCRRPMCMNDVFRRGFADRCFRMIIICSLHCRPPFGQISIAIVSLHSEEDRLTCSSTNFPDLKRGGDQSCPHQLSAVRKDLLLRRLLRKGEEGVWQENENLLPLLLGSLVLRCKQYDVFGCFLEFSYAFGASSPGVVTTLDCASITHSRP